MNCHAESKEMFIPTSGEKQGETVERLLLLVFLTWSPLHQGQRHLPVSLSVQVIARRELQDKELLCWGHTN